MCLGKDACVCYRFSTDTVRGERFVNEYILVELPVDFVQVRSSFSSFSLCDLLFYGGLMSSLVAFKQLCKTLSHGSVTKIRHSSLPVEFVQVRSSFCSFSLCDSFSYGGLKSSLVAFKQLCKTLSRGSVTAIRHSSSAVLCD